MLLDLLVVRDERDIIKIHSDRAIEAVKNLTSNIKVGKISAFDTVVANTGKRMLCFLSGRYSDVPHRLESFRRHIEYQFVLKKSCFVVFVNEYKAEEEEINNDVNDDLVATADLDDLKTWWPSVVKFLFEVQEFPNKHSCYLQNLESLPNIEPYPPAEEIFATIFDLFEGLGLGCSDRSGCTWENGVVVLRYMKRNDEDKKRIVRELQNNVKHLYVIATCVRTPERCVRSFEFYSSSEVLKCSLAILENLGVIDTSVFRKEDRAYTKYLGIYMQISKDKPVQAFDLVHNTRERRPIDSLQESNEGDTIREQRQHCTVSVTLRCAVLSILLSIVVFVTCVTGLVLLASSHTPDIRPIEASIIRINKSMHAIEVVHIAEFEEIHTMIAELRNETYNLIEVLRNETLEEIEKVRNETIESLRESNSSISSEIEDLRTDTEQQIADSTVPSVAFYAYSLSDRTPSRGEQMFYAHTLLNEGSAYSASTGRFTAPVDGLYFFAVKACLQSSDRTYSIRIIVAGLSKYFTMLPYRTYSCYTGTFTNIMTRGSTAYVVSGYNHQDYSSYFMFGQGNAFSGYLVNYLVDYQNDFNSTGT